MIDWATETTEALERAGLTLLEALDEVGVTYEIRGGKIYIPQQEVEEVEEVEVVE